jgi:uncharacterized protein (DUF433 family)
VRYRTHQETHAAATDIGTLITRSADARGGRPRIAGTGVTIRRIASLHNQGATPEAIAERIGHLSLAQVHAALSYYYANRAEIDADLANEDAAYDRLLALIAPHIPEDTTNEVEFLSSW